METYSRNRCIIDQFIGMIVVLFTVFATCPILYYLLSLLSSLFYSQYQGGLFIRASEYIWGSAALSGSLLILYAIDDRLFRLILQGRYDCYIKCMFGSIDTHEKQLETKFRRVFLIILTVMLITLVSIGLSTYVHFTGSKMVIYKTWFSRKEYNYRDIKYVDVTRNGKISTVTIYFRDGKFLSTNDTNFSWNKVNSRRMIQLISTRSNAFINRTD